jgi:beta-ribofuranosylaminobenzene 5'-phosphate synthase
MHAGAPRKNGGIGFAVAEPQARIHIRRAKHLQVIDDRMYPMPHAEIVQLVELVQQLIDCHQLRHAPEIHISGAMRTHVGMGSGTAIRLGAIEGTARLSGLRLPSADLVRVSGRGGTSGIGINTYFSGHLVLDLGIPMDFAGYGPSSSARSPRLPTALPKVPMPKWPMILCVPRSIVPKTQPQEVEFFKRTAPLPASRSFEATYVALFELYAAALEENYAGFCLGVSAMQATAWKHAECAEYGPALLALKRDLMDRGLDCVGMSSLGPMLFGFGPPGVLADIASDTAALDCEVFRTNPSNLGRALEG